jgi:hypothetical protein
MELDLAARADSDDHDAPVRGERLEVALHVGRADQLEDHVEWTAVLEALGRDHLGAERRDRIAAAPGCDSSDHARARGPAELNRRRSHAACRAVHQ